MAIPTIADIIAIDLGYLTGADILQFCPDQHIIKQQSINPNALIAASAMAYEELKANLTSRYQIDLELAKTGNARYLLTVKIAALLTIRNFLGNSAMIPANTKAAIDDCKEMLHAIRNGELSLLLVKLNEDVTNSQAKIIDSSFRTIG
jgi:hypothetical protein